MDAEGDADVSIPLPSLLALVQMPPPLTLRERVDAFVGRPITRALIHEIESLIDEIERNILARADPATANEACALVKLHFYRRICGALV